MFSGYARCLIQDQQYHVEVWIEKDALLPIFERIVYPYCLRVISCRGFQSFTGITDAYSRFEKAQNGGKIPVILYFGDYDPDGLKMLFTIQDSLENELGMEGIIYDRCAITVPIINRFDLPNDPSAAKKSSPRYKWFVENYGDEYRVELDALHPKQLEVVIKESIGKYIDRSDFNAQKEIEEIERQRAAELRTKTLDFVGSLKV